MKDKNGIGIKCENCRHYEYCDDKFYPDVANGGEGCNFEPSVEAYEARIKELQDELYADKYNYESWEEILYENYRRSCPQIKIRPNARCHQTNRRQK